MCTTTVIQELGKLSDRANEDFLDAQGGDFSGLENQHRINNRIVDPQQGLIEQAAGWDDQWRKENETGDADPYLGSTPLDSDADTDDDDDDDVLPTLLGRLASGWRTDGTGQGIGANILSGGAGVKSKPRTSKRSLLG